MINKSDFAHNKEGEKKGGRGFFTKGLFSLLWNKFKKQIPLLIFILGLFLLVVGFSAVSLNKIQGGDNIYLTVMAIEMLVFVLPAMMFCRYRGMSFLRDTNLILPGISKLPFVFFALLFLIFSNVIITLLLFSGSSPVDGATSTLSPVGLSGGDTIGGILIFAVIPAICEEFVFRCVLMSEFKKYGYLTSIIITSLLFAMVHFNLEGFMIYFFSGLVLGITAYITRSVGASILLHVLYNLYGLFFEGELWGAISRNVNIILVIFIAVVVMLVSLMVCLAEAQRMFMDYSITGIKPPDNYLNREEVENYEEKIKRRRISSLTAFFTPGVLAALGVFICVLVF